MLLLLAKAGVRHSCMCLHICDRHHVGHTMLFSALLLQAEPATAEYKKHAKYLRLLRIVT